MSTISGGTPEARSALLVDKHAVFRQALACVLEYHAGFEQTSHMQSLADARDCSPGAVDVAIVSLCHPSGEEFDTVRTLRDSYPRAIVLALTLSRDPEYHARAVLAGADMVLNKDASLEEILHATRSHDA